MYRIYWRTVSITSSLLPHLRDRGAGDGCGLKDKTCFSLRDLEQRKETIYTSNGGYRREEKSHNAVIFGHCNFFICEIKSRAIVCIECTENQRKIGLSQMSSMS